VAETDRCDNRLSPERHPVPSQLVEIKPLGIRVLVKLQGEVEPLPLQSGAEETNLRWSIRIVKLPVQIDPFGILPLPALIPRGVDAGEDRQRVSRKLFGSLRVSLTSFEKTKERFHAGGFVPVNPGGQANRLPGATALQTQGVQRIAPGGRTRLAKEMKLEPFPSL
jgi:hypothetical protein